MKNIYPIKLTIFILFLTVGQLALTSTAYAQDQKEVRRQRKKPTKEELANTKTKVGLILGQSSAVGKKNVRTTSSTPMVLTGTEMNTISSPRSSWLTLSSDSNTVSMDVKAADMTNPQAWSLPVNILDEFDYYYNEDFIPVAEVPNDLKFPGANKVVKSTYLDSEENTIELYEHYTVSADAIDFIGISYFYYLDEDEDAFDLQDYKFTDVPLQLGDGYTYIQSEDEPSLRNLRYYEITKSVDAFGTLDTPYGTFDCLRISFSTIVYARSDTSSAYMNAGNYFSVGFVTEQGHTFVGNTSGISGNVTFTDVELRVVAPTGILSEQIKVQINNDGDGVLITNTQFDVAKLSRTADANAILELKSDDKGILIPRLNKANRPASPNEGLLIYQLDDNPGFYYYTGSAWTRLDATVPTPPSARVAAEIAMAQEEKQRTGKSFMKGFGKLVNGSAFVPFNMSNGQSPEEVLIQLQPEGECNGLYISKKTTKGFEVKELKNGKSTIGFSWMLDQK